MGKDTQKKIDQLGVDKRDADSDILQVETEQHAGHLET